MLKANKVLKSNISGVERVLVRGKGWIPAEEIEEYNEVKTKTGWIKLGMDIISNIRSYYGNNNN